MQISVEATGGLEKRMTVEVPAKIIELEIKKRLKSMQPTVKLHGFRPGKVPMSVVEKRFAGKVRSEVTGEVVNSSFVEAVGNEDLRPAGMPKIESQTHDETSGLKYTAVFEVYPEVKINPVNEIKLEREIAEIVEADLDSMIEKLRNQRVEWSSVDRAAQEGDRVTIDYKGVIDGESFAGGEGKELEVVIGSNTMIEGFEDGLLSGKVGQTIELDLTFPDDYKAADIAGKAVHFSVTITAVEAPKLPEVNDEFIKGLGVESGNVNAFREELKGNMSRELDKITKTKVKSAVMDALLSANTFDIPESMITAESQRVAQQMNEQVEVNQSGKMPGKIPSFEGGQFRDQGRRRVALGLILAEIIKDNELKASSDKVRKEIEELAVSYHNPKEIVSWYYQDKSRLQEIESMVLEGQVVDWVLENAQVTDIQTTFEEITKKSR